ncbi:MAG: hypothetical protein Q8M24_16860 [Pseudolabrys sp.]|nr:hypothetical protein [Pseudolabrys sp.]MDP2297116.1 hypothetical protein [Pseudolabrys sp.]
MMPASAVLPLLLFMMLVLMLSLHGLAAAGHFPHERRTPALRSFEGTLILFGSLTIAAVCLAAGLIAAWQRIPWYAAVIGGGAVALLAPLVLQLFPDRFVDSRCALIGFAGAAAMLALLIWFV